MVDPEGSADSGEQVADHELPSNADLEARLNESLKHLSDPQREVIQTVMQIEARHHRGPLPPASELVAYDAALPGLAREIVDNAKSEQTHRHRMDRQTGNQEFILNIAGLVAIILALILMLSIVAYMVHSGAPTAAATLGGAIIVGVVVALTNYNKQTATTSHEKSATNPKKDV